LKLNKDHGGKKKGWLDSLQANWYEPRDHVVTQPTTTLTMNLGKLKQIW
jgi:hypothetical protein